MPSPSRYSTPAIVIHWVTAALIFVAFPLGKYMHGLPLSPQKLELYSYHKWLGVTVLLLFLPRLLVRLARPSPALLPAPQWQLKLAGITHTLLYLLIALVPLSGWLMSSAKGFPVVYLGIMPLPDLVGKDKEFDNFLKEVHEALSTGLALLVILHLGAAVKHHLIDKDGTLHRMWPGHTKNVHTPKAS
ncbi:MAG: cytochrome b [Rhodocyclaceae bacterium]|jgi:cytochrome b561|nr:cytochrome b [Rhodocyclaceae bacterium]